MFELAQPLDGSDYSDTLDEAASLALEAETAEVRSAVDSHGGTDRSPLIRDNMDFREACSDAGYDFAGD